MAGSRNGMVAGLALLAVAAGPAAPTSRVVSGDRTVAATVAGVPARLQIDPDVPGPPILSPAFAARAGLKKGMFAVRYRIGPVLVDGTSAVQEFAMGSDRFKRRVVWFDRAFASDGGSPVDGWIGPSALPEDVVRFNLRAAAPGDRTVALPMVDGGGLFGGLFGLYGEIAVNGHPIRIRFDLRHTRTLASAGAGNVIAVARGGVLSGAVAPADIVFGVARPVRTLRLARPLAIGPFGLSELGVRVSDYGDAGNIPDADRAPDPDEIVVTGKARKRDHAHDQIRLGLDRLGACASIVFDKPARLIRLTCA